MDTRTPLRRLARQVFPWRNPVAELGDRVEAVVAAASVAVTLLGLPVAAAIGSEVYVAQAELSAEQLRTRHPVEAVLLRDAPSSDGRAPAFADVPARWSLPDGGTREGEVTAARDLVAGSTVRIWVDLGGARVAPPLTAEGAVVAAAAAATGAWLALGGGMALAYVLVRGTHTRMRRHRLETEWAAVEPQWRRSA